MSLTHGIYLFFSMKLGRNHVKVMDANTDTRASIILEGFVKGFEH